MMLSKWISMAGCALCVALLGVEGCSSGPRVVVSESLLPADAPPMPVNYSPKPARSALPPEAMPAVQMATAGHTATPGITAAVHHAPAASAPMHSPMPTVKMVGHEPPRHEKHHAASAAQTSHGDTNEADAATEVLKVLNAGNATFVHNTAFAARRAELISGQHPVAAILSCADSRVSPELIFSEGLGDVFPVRVAGNVASPEALGSLEYAVEHLHVPVVIVLGHEHCGAVKATLAGGEAPGSIGSLVKRIEPAVASAKAKAAHTGSDDEKALLQSAIELNVEEMVKQVKASPIVAEAIEAGHTRVLGAVYSLETGRVSWQ